MRYTFDCRLGVVGVMLAAACGRPCAMRFEAADKDWCVASEAIGAARGGNLARARALAESIQFQPGRAAAIEGILTHSMDRITRTQAVEWCELLDDTYGSRCLDTWDRAEFWE